MNIELTHLIKENTVNFHRFKSNTFYYRIVKDDETYEFTIPLREVKDAELLHEDKAIIFMRYIREAIKSGRLTKILN